MTVKMRDFILARFSNFCRRAPTWLLDDDSSWKRSLLSVKCGQNQSNKSWVKKVTPRTCDSQKDTCMHARHVDIDDLKKLWMRGSGAEFRTIDTRPTKTTCRLILTRNGAQSGHVGGDHDDQRQKEHENQGDDDVELFLPFGGVRPVSNALVKYLFKWPSNNVKDNHLEKKTSSELVEFRVLFDKRVWYLCLIFVNPPQSLKVFGPDGFA